MNCICGRLCARQQSCSCICVAASVQHNLPSSQPVAAVPGRLSAAKSAKQPTSCGCAWPPLHAGGKRDPAGAPAAAAAHPAAAAVDGDDPLTTAARLKMLMDKVGELAFSVMELQGAARPRGRSEAGGAEDNAAVAERDALLEQRVAGLEMQMGCKADQVSPGWLTVVHTNLASCMPCHTRRTGCGPFLGGSCARSTHELAVLACMASRWAVVELPERRGCVVLPPGKT